MCANMLGKSAVILIWLIFAASASAKVFSKCEFARAIKDAGLQNVGTWACIAQHESNFNTQAINHQTGDYGILQISSIYWCNNGPTPGKGCDITCQSLLVDNISGSIKCARTVFDQTQRGPSKNGFTAWTTYKFCQGDQSGYVKECNL